MLHSIDENDLDPSAQRVDPHPQGPLVESSKGTNQGSNDLFLRLRRPSIAVSAKNEDSNDAPIVDDGLAFAFSQTDCKSRSCPGIRSLPCLSPSTTSSSPSGAKSTSVQTPSYVRNNGTIENKTYRGHENCLYLVGDVFENLQQRRLASIQANRAS